MTTHLKTMLRHGALPAVAIGVLTLAGCSSDSGASSSRAGDSSGSSPTISIRDEGDGQVLATSDGRTLYVSDQENGAVLCASQACEEIWAPLLLTTGQEPTAPA